MACTVEGLHLLCVAARLPTNLRLRRHHGCLQHLTHPHIHSGMWTSRLLNAADLQSHALGNNRVFNDLPGHASPEKQLIIGRIAAHDRGRTASVHWTGGTQELTRDASKVVLTPSYGPSAVHLLEHWTYPMQPTEASSREKTGASPASSCPSV